MAAFFSSLEARIVIALGLLAMVAAVGYYVIAKVRAIYLDEEEDPRDHLLGDVVDLYTSGKLSEEEYRAIRSKVAGEMLERVNRKQPAD